MDIEIREYQDQDFEGVCHILQEAFSCSRGKIEGDTYREVVAIKDQKVVGYLLLTKVWNPMKEKNYMLVDYVCVSSECRGQGIGKQLLDFAEKIAKEEDVMYLQLTCSHFRVAAHKLYEKCNYVKRDSDIFRKEIV